MSDSEPEQTTEVSEDIVDKRRGGRSGCVVGCLLSSIIFYALSPPLMGILMTQVGQHGSRSSAEALNKFVRVAYAPLKWLYDNVEAVQSFYKWYSGLFERWMTP